MGTLFAATQSALKDRQSTESDHSGAFSKEYVRGCFKSVWVGLAGIDRLGFREMLIPRITELFGLSIENDLRLTNDVDLLAASMEQHPVAQSAIVAIAGTGTVAMRYTRANEGYKRVARSGGWGHILGDEGGGYAIGLQAIKHTLTTLEEKNLGLYEGPLGELEKRVLKRLGCHDSDSGKIDLLSELLAQQRMQNVKGRIAGVAEVVLNAAETHEAAAALVDSQSRFFVQRTLARLVNPKCGGYVPPENSGLVLTGSVMTNPYYKASILAKLEARGIRFLYVETVNDAVSTGARYLAPILSAEE